MSHAPTFLLLEDHPIVRIGLRQLIARRWPEATIIEAATLQEALAQLRSQVPQAAVVDLNLPDAQGLESITRLRRAAPDLRLLVLSFNEEAAYASRALQLGAWAYLNKDQAGAELVLALERLLAGQRYLSPSQADRLAGQLAGATATAPHETLAPQEYRVLTLLADGLKLTEIGEAMHLSPKTVTSYRARILDKLGLSNNSELVRYCIDHGIGGKSV